MVTLCYASHIWNFSKKLKRIRKRDYVSVLSSMDRTFARNVCIMTTRRPVNIALITWKKQKLEPLNLLDHKCGDVPAMCEPCQNPESGGKDKENDVVSLCSDLRG